MRPIRTTTKKSQKKGKVAELIALSVEKDRFCAEKKCALSKSMDLSSTGCRGKAESLGTETGKWKTWC